ncbi:MAG TPA: CapA family protein [Candidatus Acidoferrales bacterium]|nr:CapA family protein [Candidatus Acidoferrales bacterium]
MPYESTSGDITIALTGDAMISRALKPFREPRFLKLRELLYAADARVTNGEMLFHNYEDWPTYLSRTYMRCDPRFIKDLQWLGINMMACANNHGTDFGETGVLTNIRYLEAAEMVHAGSGENYAAAVAPAYLDTPRGRVALVSATSSGRPNSRAGEQRRDMKGRPGVNLIRWVNEWTVDRAAFEALSRIAAEFRWKQRPEAWWRRAYNFAAEDPNAVYFLDRNTLGVGSEDPAARFVLGEGFERHTRAHRQDLERNLQSVSEARRMADWVVFAMHNHEGGKSIDEPSDHVRELAHAVIDAGADLFIGHGPHLDRGIEIYNGKPILYSLGNFVIQNDTVLRLPHESMVAHGLGHENSPADLYDVRSAEDPRGKQAGDPHWQSAVATVSFSGKTLREVRLYPLEFGLGLPRGQRGRPILAEGKAAREILERFQRLCEPFQTGVEIRGEEGVIEIKKNAPGRGQRANGMP